MKLSILKILFLLIICGLSGTLAQTPDQIAQEARSRGIDSRAKAINELAKNGISLSQAREMASLKGMDFDAFLDDYLNSLSPSAISLVVADQAAGEVATEITVAQPLQPIQPEPIAAPIPKADPSYFGYNIFDNNPFGSKDYLVGNIDEGYLLAPGDELRISVFGDNNLEQVATIDLNGNISIPGLGVFQAAGYTYGNLTQRLRLFLGRYYSGLLSTPARSFLDVSLTQIRPVKVTILGQVNTPGPHLINGLATVLNALYASGGVKTSGTLRDVKVYRGNKLLRSFDLYDFITTGNIDQDTRLANNDIIFIGPRLSSVTLEGAVKQGGIYELKKGETTKDLFRFSGELPTNAAISAVNITRITPFENRTQSQAFDRFLTTVDLKNEKEFTLQDGDKVSLLSIQERVLNQVTLEGSIKNPGTYSLKTYPDLLSLISRAGAGLLPNTYLNKVDVYSEDESGDLSFKTFNLESVLQGKIKIGLTDKDRVVIYSKKQVEGESLVSISGFVAEPKELFWRDNLSLFDVIFESTSFEELEFQAKVLDSRLDVKRFDANSGQYNLLTFSLNDLNNLKSTYLDPKDMVVLYTKGVTIDVNPTISVLGSVNNQGEFPLGLNMLVEDAILAAGGFTEFADKTMVDLYSKDQDALSGKYAALSQHLIDMDYLLGYKSTPENPTYLKNYDVIVARTPKDADVQPSVTISGEVIFPGTFILENSNISASALVSVAGGLTGFAHLQSSYVLRDGKPLSSNLSKSDVSSLLPGDQIVINSTKNSVSTAGNVANPSIFVYRENRRAKYYLRNSGGTKERTQDKFVTHPSGKTKKIGWFRNPKVAPGSQVVVTKKLENTPGDKGAFLDDFIKIFSVVTGALTTAILATKL